MWPAIVGPKNPTAESRLRAVATAHVLPSEPTLRRAEQRDLDGLVRLEQRCFDLDRLSRRSLWRFLRQARASLLVAERPAGGGLAGYALVTLRRGARVARLYALAVDPSERRRGLGRRLLRAAEAAASSAGAAELRLEVRADNREAISAYEADGYRPIGRYPAYYEDGAEALRFAKSLPAPKV